VGCLGGAPGSGLSCRPDAVGEPPGAVAERSKRAGRGQQHPGGADTGYTAAAEDENHGPCADAGADRQHTEHGDSDEHSGGVEHGRVNADGVQHQPVARDLGRDSEHDKQGDAGAGARFAERGEASPPSARVAPGQPGEPCDAGENRAEGDERCPPRQAEGCDERERGQRRERDFHQHDRYLGRREDNRLGGLPRCCTPKRCDAHREPQLAVDDIAEVAHACCAVQAPAADGPPGGVHAYIPRLAARHQRRGL